MRTSVLTLACSLALLALSSSVAGAQQGSGHPHDISGVYSRGIYGADNANGISLRDTKLNPPPGPVPYRPGAADAVAKRLAARGNNLATCNPSGPFGALVQAPGSALMAGYGNTVSALEIVQIPGRVFIFIDAGHTYRTIWMTDKHDIDHLVPSYMGHSIGRWEGDTLVVDTVNFNGQIEITNGFVPSDQLHTVERFRRNGQNLEYHASFEDPQFLTAPWVFDRTLSFRAGWKYDAEVFCVSSDQVEFLERVDLPSKKR